MVTTSRQTVVGQHVKSRLKIDALLCITKPHHNSEWYNIVSKFCEHKFFDRGFTMQTRLGSLVESVVNIIIGLVINVTAQYFVFPLFGIHIPLSQNLSIALIFTFISLVRSYVLRRIFNKWRRFYA